MSGKTEAASVIAPVLRGIAWTAGSSWLQLAVSLTSFAVVTTRLVPADIGAFGMAQLICTLCVVLIGGPLGDALKQRADLQDDHIHSTFWIALVSGLVVGAVFIGVAVAVGLDSSGTAFSLAALSICVPAGIITNVLNALLARDLRFPDLALASGSSTIAAGFVLIAAVFMGWGLSSLVAAEVVRALIGLAQLAGTRIYRIALPARWRAFLDLMRFNVTGLGSYLAGYGDRLAPRALVGALLGPVALGYFIVAERVLDLLGQVVLTPLSGVTMAAVARLQSDAEGLRQLIRQLYRLATLFGYPAFIGAIVVVPLLAELAGAHWTGAVLPAQILLLVGLRTTTGAFNLAILRGVGQPGLGLVLLACGLALQLLLLPLGILGFGLTGAALAVLMRTYATWPLGCWYVRRATGLPFVEQLLAGRGPLAASLIMAAVMILWLRGFDHYAAPWRLATSVLLGCAVYATALMVISADIRVRTGLVLGALRQSGVAAAFRCAKAQFGSLGSR